MLDNKAKASVGCSIYDAPSIRGQQKFCDSKAQQPNEGIIMILPTRKHARLFDYDYSKAGAYFITICVQNKQHLLGKITGGNDTERPIMILSDYGKTVEGQINAINSRNRNISINKYVIMPNHIHFLVHIDNIENNTAAPNNNEIPKLVSVLKRCCNREFGRNIWQRSYHDHIIRGEKDYREIWNYIDTNVDRWKKDCFYTDEN